MIFEVMYIIILSADRMVGINYTSPQVALNFYDTVGLYQYTN